MEWDASDVTDFIADQLFEDGFDDGLDGVKDVFNGTENSGQDEAVGSVTWCTVDLTNLDISELNSSDGMVDEQNNENLWMAQSDEENNNNYMEERRFVRDANLKNQTQMNGTSANCLEELQNREIKFLDARTRRASKGVKQPPIMGDNDVIWPSVLLNYTKNVDPSISPHHYCTSQK